MVCSVSEPALSPHEAALLVAFIRADYDLSALISSQSLTDEQAIDFVTSPAIQAKLGGLKKFTDLSDHLFNSKYRRKAIAALNLVVERQSSPTGDPVELRKAATSLLRRTESPERPSGAASRGSSSSHSSSTSFPSNSPANPLASNSREEAPSATRAARLDSSPDTILAAMADSAARLDTSETTSILRATLSEDAQSDGEPITDESFTDDRRALHHLVHAVGHVQLGRDASNTSATYSLAVVNSEGDSVPIYIEFNRINLTSASERWRITAISSPAMPSDKGARDTS